MSRGPAPIQRTNAFQVPTRLRQYRYRLRFEINPTGQGRFLFVGLNPSTASLTRRDPTVDVFCRAFALRAGYRELEIANLFALRSTDKTALLRANRPVGPECNQHLVAATKEADAVLMAWGMHFHEKVAKRAAEVEKLLRQNANCPLLIIARNADSSPTHPLYRRHDTPLIQISDGTRPLPPILTTNPNVTTGSPDTTQ